jgi:hypothetical protein
MSFCPGWSCRRPSTACCARRLAEMESADTAVNCLIAMARAEGMVEALELVKALESSRIERLYQLVVDTAAVRLQVLQQEGNG